MYTWYFIIKLRVNLPPKIKQLNKIKDILTSYEILWATARTDPNKAYLEFENQPAPITPYTPNLETHKNISILKPPILQAKKLLYRIHKTKPKNKFIKGQIKKGKILTKVGLTNSFLNNLIASAKGWGRPINPTLFGPLRNWK